MTWAGMEGGLQSGKIKEAYGNPYFINLGDLFLFRINKFTTTIVHQYRRSHGSGTDRFNVITGTRNKNSRQTALIQPDIVRSGVVPK
jgi:hypothetical protein